jgi:SAM-dependent methyltransferase
MPKNPPEFYGQDYLKSPVGSVALKEGTEKTNRWEDNGTYYGAALVAAALAQEFGILPRVRFSDGSLEKNKDNTSDILDVGCGRGFVVRHLKNLRFAAAGCEYAPMSEVQPVERHIYRGDLTETLPFDDGAFGLTICLGVLSHLPEDDVPHAIRELTRVTRRAIWTNILVIDHPLQKHHQTIRPPHWWQAAFKSCGLREVGRAGQWMWAHKMTISPYSWPMVWEPRGRKTSLPDPTL